MSNYGTEWSDKVFAPESQLAFSKAWEICSALVSLDYMRRFSLWSNSMKHEQRLVLRSYVNVEQEL